jgi:hypothetical protein
MERILAILGSVLSGYFRLRLGAMVPEEPELTEPQIVAFVGSIVILRG